MPTKVPGPHEKPEVLNLGIEVLPLLHLDLEVRPQLALSGKGFGMLPQKNVYAVLREVFGPSVHKVALHVFELVIDFPKESFFTIFGDFGDS